MPRERADILTSLTAKGFELEQGSRDHDFLFFAHHGKRQPVYTKLSRGKQYRTIGDPLLSKIARQLHLNRKELDLLVDCPMTREQFLGRLEKQGVIEKQVSPGAPK